jgi:DNA mismatch endonuclease (patch repair protein)
MDVLTADQRHNNMSRIRGRNTRPELVLRKGLHARGLRFRLHVKDLPGKPDLVFPRFHVVMFVHGCFWHGHDCPLFKVPGTRTGFWLTKIGTNRTRDERNCHSLAAAGWRILTVWECSLRGPAKLGLGEVLDLCQTYLTSGEQRSFRIAGNWPPGPRRSRTRTPP